MSSNEMKNPYEESAEEMSVVVGPRSMRVGIVSFLLLITVPGILALGDMIFGEKVSTSPPTLEARLRGWEDRFEDAPLFEKWREKDQVRLVRWFAEGNPKVLIGRKGWLYYRPDLDALVGKGPRYEEPPSVARAPEERAWRRSLPVIEHFARQLRDREISLVLVPVPTKAMIETEGLGIEGKGAETFRLPPGWDFIVAELRDAGIRVVDLFPPFRELGGEADLFLKQDTHWTPETMKAVAERLAGELEDDFPRGDVLPRREVVTRSSHGDLVEMLQSGERGGSVFPPEVVQLERILDASSGKPIDSDSASPIVLLGDSFVNVFEDPSLGFGEKGEDRIGGGLSSHLAAALGRTLHVIAINGGGATDVRKAFATLPDDRVREKKVVLWVLSSRDLLLAEIPGRRAGIEWSEVTFSAARSVEPTDGSSIVISGRLRERSQVGDPTQTPYASAIYSGIFDEIEVESGRFEESEAWVFLWAFRDRKLLETAALRDGDRYRLTLVPFPESGPASAATQLDDFFRVDLSRWFATKAEPIPDE